MKWGQLQLQLHDKLVDGIGTGGIFKALFNVRSPDTIKEWGEKLQRQHRPQDMLDLPPFMQPKAEPPPVAETSLAKKLICAHCHAKIGYPEGKFCWNNAKRFGGVQYCREHQGLFA